MYISLLCLNSLILNLIYNLYLYSRIFFFNSVYFYIIYNYDLIMCEIVLKFFIYSIYNILFFQEAVTPVMEGIVDFHNYCFIYLINIFILIIWFLTYIVFSGYWVWLYEKFNYYYLSIKFIEEVDESADEKYQIYMFNPSYFEFKKLLDYKNLVNCEEITYYKYLDEFLLVRKITQNVNIELIWTIIPMIIII